MDHAVTRDSRDVPHGLSDMLSQTPGITRQKTELGETYIVGFDGEDDPYSPQQWPMKKK